MKITEKHEAAFEPLADNEYRGRPGRRSQPDIADDLGVHPRTIKKWIADPDFQAAYQDYKRRRRQAFEDIRFAAPRERVLTAGGFDPKLRNAQDFDLWLAMTRDPGQRFLVFGEPLLRYHITPGGIMSHTARRLDCCLKIAKRYIPDIKQRPGGGVADLWFRVTALHLEAIRSYANQGDLAGELLTAGKMPLSLLSMTLFYFFRPPRPRGNYLDAGDDRTENSKHG